MVNAARDRSLLTDHDVFCLPPRRNAGSASLPW
jgi:hypothetical protein